MMLHHVLAVEDEKPMQDFYRYFFETRHPEEFRWRLAEDGGTAVTLLAQRTPDTVVLDWNLPDIQGTTILEILRRNAATRRVNVLMVSGLSSPRDAAIALELGADDFLGKPVEEVLLLAKLRSLARRRELFHQEQGAFEQSDLRLDHETDRLTIAGRKVDLPPKEMDLLKLFLKRPGSVLTHDYLWAAVWGYDSPDSRHTLTALVSSLRGRLGPRWGPRIESVKGRGYRLAV